MRTYEEALALKKAYEDMPEKKKLYENFLNLYYPVVEKINKISDGLHISVESPQPLKKKNK